MIILSLEIYSFQRAIRILYMGSLSSKYEENCEIDGGLMSSQPGLGYKIAVE